LDVATNLPDDDDGRGQGGRLLRQQLEIGADVALVQQYGEALPVDDFGGVWFDNARDPVVFVLAVTVSARDHAAVLDRLVEHPDRVDVVSVSRSRKALLTIRDAVLALADEYPINMSGLDLPQNVVAVGLSRDDRQVRVAIARRFGSAVRVDPGTRGYLAV
jgi:hypothetical protein